MHVNTRKHLEIRLAPVFQQWGMTEGTTWEMTGGSDDLNPTRWMTLAMGTDAGTEHEIAAAQR